MSPFTLVIGNKNYSSWSLRPWLVMKQMGIAFEEVRIPLCQADTRDRLLQYSPSGKVPVLIHGDLAVWESIAICEYLADLFPEKSWYPTDLKARAIARSVSQEMHAGFVNLRTHMAMDMRSRHPGKGRETGVQEDIDRILAIWRTCRQQFGEGGPFLFGEFTVADAMYAPVVSRFTTYGVTLDSIAQAYIDAVWQLPAMQEWLEAAIAEVEVIG